MLLWRSPFIESSAMFTDRRSGIHFGLNGLMIFIFVSFVLLSLDSRLLPSWVRFFACGVLESFSFFKHRLRQSVSQVDTLEQRDWFEFSTAFWWLFSNPTLFKSTPLFSFGTDLVDIWAEAYCVFNKTNFSFDLSRNYDQWSEDS